MGLGGRRPLNRSSTSATIALLKSQCGKVYACVVDTVHGSAMEWTGEVHQIVRVEMHMIFDGPSHRKVKGKRTVMHVVNELHCE
jgi:hypothetical protein